MKITTINDTQACTAATVAMAAGDRLHIAVLGADGEYQIVNVMVQGLVTLIEHEQSGDALIIRPAAKGCRTQYVKG